MLDAFSGSLCVVNNAKKPVHVNTVPLNIVHAITTLCYFILLAEVHRVRFKGKATETIHSKSSFSVSHMVVGDVTRLRIRNLYSDNDQHGGAGHEGWRIISFFEW
jgi:hypothetical protein